MVLRSTRARLSAALIAMFVLFLLAALFGSSLLEDILAPANALLAAGVLFYVYSRSSGHRFNRISLLLIAIGCIMWAIAGILKAYLDTNGYKLMVDQVYMFIRMLANLSFAISFFALFIDQFNQRNRIQFALDILSISVLSALFLWIVFFHKNSHSLLILMKLDVTILVSLALDVLLGIGLLQWFISLLSGHIPRYWILLVFSGNLFAVSDIAFHYFTFWDVRIPMALMGILFVISLAGLAFSGLWQLDGNDTVADVPPVSSTNVSKRWILMLVIPLSTLFLTAIHFVPVTLSTMDILFSALLIILHWVFSRHIQLTLENERLLALEKYHNATLEKCVADQVQELIRLANQDLLTSLSNRRCFMNELEDHIHALKKDDALIVIMLDIDRFKTINDSYSTEVGDAALVAFSRLMVDWVQSRGVVARLGGDEFGLLIMGNIVTRLDALCAELVELFNRPLTINDKTLQVTVSLGMAVHTPGVEDSRLLIQNAEIALHQSKSQGYNRYQLFDPLYSRDIMVANKIELLLRQEDFASEFELFYQPQFSLPDRRLVGAEALIRWHNAEHGYISPSVFIPVAERGGFICKIGQWVFQQAIQQASIWNRNSQLPLKIGINLSPVQLDDDAFLDSLQALLSGANVQPNQFDIEVTENVMIRRMDETIAIFEQFRKQGFSISIDDFGSGYSSMIYLNRFPFDRLKIDKSLIDTILTPGGSGLHIVKSIIDMSKTLGIQTIAEGVERDDQLELLIQLGCDQVQGYLLGRPVPADDFVSMFMS